MEDKHFSTKSSENKLLSLPDLLSIAKDVLMEWWLIILVGIAASMIAGIVVESTYTPVYQTKATFVVTAKGGNTNIVSNLSSANQLATQFSQILDSQVLKQRVAEEAGLDKFDAEMEVNLVPETNLMELTVTADTAMNAFNIIQSVMKNYNQVSDYVIENVILEVLQAPTIPMGPSNSPNADRAKKLSAYIAAAAMALLIAVASYYKDTIKSEKDVAEKVDAHLVGTLYHEQKWKSLKGYKNRKQIAMTIKNPMLSFRFVQCNKLMASKIRSRMDKKGAKTIVVTSVTENEGKSTVAANLALALAEEKKRVLLMDCDFRKPAQYKIFDVDPETVIDFNDVMTGQRDAKNLIQPIKGTTLYGIFNLTANMHMFESGEGKLLGAILKQLKHQVDYIVIDTAPIGLVAETEEVSQMTDASLLVVRHDYVWTKDINDAIDALNKTKGQVLGCVLNDMSVAFSSGGAQGFGHSSGYRYGGHYGKRTE